jgi:hypothetical protein
MSKQVPAETCPQQLLLDLESPKAVSNNVAASPRIAAFVDASTRDVRQQAVERVKAAGIFQISRSRPSK